MKKENKLRALCLLKALYELSDESHPLSTTELIALLNERYRLDVHRTTIASDVEQLKNFGIDIRTIKSSQNKYFLAGRMFEIAELKLLVDAVQTASFITKEESANLLEKLSTLTSLSKADALKRNLYSNETVQQSEKWICDVAEIINAAINNGKKISFQRFQYNVKKEKELTHNGAACILSPYALIQKDGRIYVVGYSDECQAVVNYRIDRIWGKPNVLKETAVQHTEDLGPCMNRTAGCCIKKENVELICDNALMDAIVDRFGIEVKTFAYDLSSFRVASHVAIDSSFYSWVFSFGGLIRIKSPQQVKMEYQAMIARAQKALEKERIDQSTC